MKTDKKSKTRKVTSLLIALAMLVTLSIPAAGAQHASALEGETQAETQAAEKPEAQSQELPTDKQETKKESTQPVPSKETATKKESALKSTQKKADAKSAVNKTAKRIEIVRQPDNNEVIEGTHYDFSGLRVKIVYNDNSEEILSYNGHEFDVPAYSPLGTECSLQLDTGKLSEKNPKVKVIYIEDDGSGEAVRTLSAEFNVTWVKAKTVKSIETTSKPKEIYAYVGLDQLILGEGLEVKINYTDGKSELVEYRYGYFDSPAYDPEASLQLSTSKVKEGDNAVVIQYGREQYSDISGEDKFVVEKTATFSVQGETIKLPTSIEIAQSPVDNTVYVGSGGDYSYNFKGMKLKIKYSNGSSEIVEVGSNDSYDTKYEPLGTRCQVRINDPSGLKPGGAKLDVVYTMENAYSGETRS